MTSLQSSDLLRVLVLGVTGMLGHALIRELSLVDALDVWGSARNVDALRATTSPEVLAKVKLGVDARSMDAVRALLDEVEPDVVVNCVGVVKQDPLVGKTVETVRLNALLPHELSAECAHRGQRLIHISTDCVFSGERGMYTEEDTPDPVDFYGRSKLLGEVDDGSALTLRTSIVGHELASARSLIDWFLSQRGVAAGYTGAIYSGLTTVEFAKMLSEVVFPRPHLSGLLHVASSPISKFELLGLVAAEYGWRGEIIPDDGLVCDRSLSCKLLREKTGYSAPDWRTMVADMRQAARRWGIEAAGRSRPAAVRP